MGSVGCESTAAVRFSPSFCPIAGLWGCKSGKNCPRWGRFSLSTPQVRQAPSAASAGRGSTAGGAACHAEGNAEQVPHVSGNPPAGRPASLQILAIAPAMAAACGLRLAAHPSRRRPPSRGLIQRRLNRGLTFFRLFYHFCRFSTCKSLIFIVSGFKSVLLCHNKL